MKQGLVLLILGLVLVQGGQSSLIKYLEGKAEELIAEATSDMVESTLGLKGLMQEVEEQQKVGALANCTQIPVEISQAVSLVYTGETYIKNLINTIDLLANHAVFNCTSLAYVDQTTCILGDFKKMKSAVNTFKLENKIFTQMIKKVYNKLTSVVKACFNLQSTEQLAAHQFIFGKM